MMFGVAGTGKTTCAEALEARDFVRLSIDEYIRAHFGRFGVDYPPSQYERWKQEAEQAGFEVFEGLLREHVACVPDDSFRSLAKRRRHRQFVDAAGGRVALLHLRASPDVLRKRLQIRSQARSASAACAIDPATLERCIAGFEEPGHDEGAIVVVQDA